MKDIIELIMLIVIVCVPVWLYYDPKIDVVLRDNRHFAIWLRYRTYDETGYYKTNHKLLFER